MRIRRMIGLVMALLLLTGCANITEKTTAPDTTDQAPGSVTITCLEGEAADTFVLIGANHVTVIDTGLDKYGPKLVKFLKSKGVTRVDNLIITHFDKDHVGGADYVIKNFNVGTIYVTYKSKDSDQIDSYLAALSAKNLTETQVTENTSFEMDGIKYDIYPPQSTEYKKKQSNNSSLVIMVSTGNSSMLFAGDAQKERIAELLEMEDIHASIIKMPHHGRMAKNTQELIEKVAPEYAIITSSLEEPEDEEVLQILEDYGVTTYLSWEGDITINMSEGSIEITQ